MTMYNEEKDLENTEPSVEVGHFKKGSVSISEILDSEDVSSLSAAKANWYFGEWHALTNIDLKSLQHHPQIATFAALKAVGYQQLGEHSECERFLLIAKNLKCDPKIIAFLLTAGVHVTLGRIAALKGDSKLVNKHFAASVTLGEKSEGLKLAQQARSVKSLAQLGLLKDVKDLVDVDAEAPKRLSSEFQKLKITYDATLRYLELSGNRQISDDSVRVKDTNVVRLLGDGRDVDVVIVGMRHSGSTAIFNVVRLAIEASGIPFESGYSERDWILEPRKTKLRLIKTHEVRDDILCSYPLIINVVRDLRDTVASAARRNFVVYQKMGALEYAKHNRAINDVWTQKEDIKIKYEEFMASPVDVISGLLDALGLEGIEASAISDMVQTLPLDDYETTLLSASHITDPDRKTDFLETLGENIVSKITAQNFEWLDRNGYL